MPLIFFVGKRYYTNRDALSEKFGRIYQLPSRWSKMGAEVFVWLLDYYGSKSQSEIAPGLKVISIPMRRISGFIGLLSLSLKLFARRPDFVVASGDCYIGMMVWVLARIFRVSFVFDVYDKYDEFPGFRRIFGFDIFAYLRKKSDLAMFASHALLAEYGNSERGDFVVPNGIDLDHFRAIDMVEARSIAGLPREPMLVGYFGSMEIDRGVDDLIQSVMLLRTRGLNLTLILAGKVREDLRVDNEGVMYMGNLPYEKIPFYLGSCNVLAIPYRRSEFMDSGSSNKIAEAIAVSRPIVATRTPNFLANFPDEAALLDSAISECGDPDSLADALFKQLSSPIVVGFPKGMDWDSISTRSLELILSRLKKEPKSHEIK